MRGNLCCAYLLALLSCSACSFLFAESNESELVDANSGPDGAASSCLDRGPGAIALPLFDQATTVNGTWGAGDSWMGALSEDETLLAIHRYSDETLSDIYTSTKTISGGFFAPSLFLGGDESEYPVFAERDGNALWYVVESGGIGSLFRAEMGDRRTMPFSLNDPSVNQSWLWLSMDQSRAYYLSDRTLTRASRVAGEYVLDDEFGNLGSSMRSFTMSCDEREVIFQQTNGGDDDLFWATRSSTSEQFSDPVTIESINTPNDEAHPWLSIDGQRLYLDYNADLSGTSEDDNNAGIQMATRQN